MIITATLNEEITLNLVVDTGATHTTIDSNVLALLDFGFGERTDSVLVETGNGLVVTDRYKLPKFEALSVTVENYIIQVYDFIAHGILSDYDGVLGLDFLEGYHFCIDTLTHEITIQD